MVQVRCTCAALVNSAGKAYLTLATQDGSIEFTSCLLPLCHIHQVGQGTLTSIFKGQQRDCAFCQHHKT